MRYIDILAYSILVILSAFGTYGFITAGSLFGIIAGTATTTLWAVSLFIRIFRHK